MRKSTAIIIGVLFGLSALVPMVNAEDLGIGGEQESTGVAIPDEDPTPDGLPVRLSNLEGFFTENRGQFDPSVEYFCRGTPLSVAFAKGGIEYLLVPTDGNPGSSPSRFWVNFEGCRPVTPMGLDPRPYSINFIRGPSQGGPISGAKGFSEVVYEGLWAGIDLRYYLSEGKLKYDVTVHPGANPRDIAFRYVGIERLGIDPATGDLIVSSTVGTIREDAPSASQTRSGVRLPIGCEFKMSEYLEVRFAIEDYDASSPLTIDPGVKFSTFLGGDSDLDEGRQICYDGSGNVVLTGITISSDFPTTEDAYDRTAEQDVYKFDIFVCRMDPTCSRILACTIVGGNGEDIPSAVRCISGAIVIVGRTNSTDFPTTPDALHADPVGIIGSSKDAFIVRLNLNCTQLLYGTYLGGNGNEGCTAGLIMDDGSVILAASTNSTDIPTTTGAYHPSYDSDCGMFVMRLDSALDLIRNCTYVDTGEICFPTSILVSADGDIVLGASSQAQGIAWPGGGYSTQAPAGENGIVMTMDATCSRIINWTYLGGGAIDRIWDIGQMEGGSIAVMGSTESPDFPLTGDAIDDTLQGRECFLSVLSKDLSDLEFSTYFGGNGDDLPRDLLLDAGDGLAHLIGTTTSSDLRTTVKAFDPIIRGERACFLATIDPSQGSLEYSTYIGCAGGASGTCGLLSTTGAVYVSGTAASPDFPVTYGAQSLDVHGPEDCFLMLFEPGPSTTLQDAPLDVRVANGWMEVNVSWSVGQGPAPPPLHFNVYRGMTLQDIALVGTTIRPYRDDSGLYSGSYLYQVSVVNSAGEGPLSAIVVGRPDGLPSAPANASGASGDGTIRITWSPTPGLEGSGLTYNVLKSEDRQVFVAIASGLEGMSYVDTDVTIGTFYYYQVRAVNEWGEGQPCPDLRVKALDVPSQPTALAAVAGDGQVTLEWGLPTRDGGMMLLGFRVYRGTGSGDMAPLATKTIFEITHIDRNVTNGVSYIYYVTAFSDVGESIPSVAMDVIPFGLPGPVRELTATGMAGTVLLTWQPPESANGRPVTRHIVSWGTDEGDLANEQEVGNVTSFRHTGLDNGVTYYYAVRPRNEAGDGPSSQVVNATPMGPPGAVMGLAAVSTASGVRLTWVPPGDTGGATSLLFRVFRDTSGDPVDVVAEVRDASEWLDTDATRGTTYHYRVVAVNDVGGGPRGEPVPVTVVFVPAQVEGLAAEAGNGAVALCWTAPDDGGSPIVRYVVLRGLFVDALAEVGQVDGTITNFTDASVQNGKTYHYAVLAVNAMGEGVASSTLSATPMDPPGVLGLFRAKVDKGAVVLTWAAPAAGGRAPVTGYVVLRGDSATDLAVLARPGDVLTYTDDTVEEGKTYYYVVHATSAVGDGERVATVEAKVPKEGGDSPGFAAVLAVVGLLAVAGLRAVRARKGR